MRRSQFSLKTLLWLIAVVAAFCGGVGLESKYHLRDRLRPKQPLYIEREVRMPDGSFQVVRSKLEDVAKSAKLRAEWQKQKAAIRSPAPRSGTQE